MLSTVVFALLLWNCAAGLHADDLSFHSDLNGKASPFPHTWRECVGSGHAALALRKDWQEQLNTVFKDLGFKRVRFHGLLDDDMSVILPNGSYLFSKIDMVYDYILSIGMYPYVELSFMPSFLASGTTTALHYKANVTPPRSYEEWAKVRFGNANGDSKCMLIGTLADHWLERYGKESITNWYIEVWNEPNLHQKIIGGFWTGSQADYFRLYNYTALAVKGVSEAFRVGGPATAEGGWLKEFIDFCAANTVPLDFVSTHGYPGLNSSLVTAIQSAKSQVGGAFPLVFSEYNSGLYFLDTNHDTSFAASFLAQVVPQVVNDTAVLSYWTFSDIFEEIFFNTEPFHDGFGLLTVDGIPKPAYRAFQLLSKLAQFSYSVQWDSQETDSEVTGYVFHQPKSSTVQVLTSNFQPPLHFPRDFNVSCNLTLPPSLVSAQPNVTLYRISPTEANPREVWEEMGRPSSLSQEQKDELMKASEVKPVQLKFTFSPAGDWLSFTTYLPFRSMALVEVSFASQKV